MSKNNFKQINSDDLNGLKRLKQAAKDYHNDSIIKRCDLIKKDIKKNFKDIKSKVTFKRLNIDKIKFTDVVIKPDFNYWWDKVQIYNY